MANLWLTTAAVALFAGGAAAAEPTDNVLAGLHLAQRHCSACHAVDGMGPSPLADAPPFRDIHKRYRSGGLPELLKEGMLRPSEPPEEGAVRHHPRMPMAVLEDDEIADLATYLRSLAPEKAPPRPSI